MSSLPVIQPTCPLCSAERFRELATYPQLQWVECGCGLIYKRSELPDPAAQDFYGSGYFGTGEQGRSYTRRRGRRIQKSRNQILDLLNHVAPAPLLDIGCSVGYTLQAARQLGLTASGADVSEFAVKTCRELGFRAEVGTLDALPYADGEFGMVTMKHVLEHTPRPRAALREVHRVLRPGGGVFIAIPHADYHKARRNPQAHGYYLPERHGSEHYVYYTPDTLKKVLKEEGFRTVRVNPELVHRHASPLRQAAEVAVAPLRALGQRAADALQARKEFWLIALRS